MAIGRKKSGLDLSGVGRRGMNLPGGDLRGHSGLQMADGRKRSGTPRGGSKRSGSYVRHTMGNGGRRDSRVSRKTVALIVALVIGSLALAIAVGALVYQQVVRNALKPDLDESGLTSTLTPVENGVTSYWGLLVRTNAASAEQGRGGATDIALMRINTENKSITFLWVPTDTRIYLDGYGYRTVQESFSLEGETGVIAAVEKLGSVKISHYAEVNQAGLGRFEEGLNPLGVDPSAADTATLVNAICQKVFGSSSEQIPSLAGSFVACVATDMDEGSVKSLMQNLQGMDASQIYQAQVPTNKANDEGGNYSAIDTDAWKTMVSRVGNGLSPVASKRDLESYESMRSGATVAIWNGVGVSGVAKDCSDELKKLGWTVSDTGNAAQFIYPETLIVYKDTNDKDLADLLASDLGQGRVVRSAARYNFTGTLLVVIGGNYRPY